MKKLLSITCLIICLILMLSSCSKDYKLKKTFDEYESGSTIHSASKISELDGATYRSTYANLAVFSKSNEYFVYDLEGKKFVKTFADVDNVYGFTVDGTPFILVHDEDMTNLYDAKGNHIATENEYIYSVTTKLDLFEFNGKVYRVEKNSATEIGAATFLTDISNFTTTANGYYYCISSNLVAVYDSNLRPTASWQKPYGTATTSVLNNGNVLIQVTRELPQDAKKYTYIEGTKKYEMSSYIMNPKNGNTKSVNLDYKIMLATYVTEDSMYNEKLQNIAYIYPIQDKYLSTSNSALKIASINNNGKIRGYLFNNLKNYDLSGDIMQVNSKRYVYESFTDDIMIVDGSGKVIGTINSITSYNGENLVIEDVIYDWNLNKKYDLDENNATISKAMAHCFIITKDGKYYRYSDTTTMQELGTTSDISLYANFYVVKNQNEYNVYNDLGEKIVALQSDSSIYLSCSFEGNYIARTYSNTSGYQYYILAK